MKNYSCLQDRNNTVERFGPVRSVKPGLVIEISFDNINVSSRHKSGVALRFQDSQELDGINLYQIFPY